MTSFGERLGAVVDDRGPLCVGIDPHARLLTSWGLADSAAGAREFGLRVVEAVVGRVGVVKPQVAFFERFGSAGFAALEEVLGAARAAGLLVIADAKRGDIGSTMDGYAGAWLTPGSPLEADALTVSSYLGPESLVDTAARAREVGKGLFLLAATSNPEAYTLQSALVSDLAALRGETVAGLVARHARAINGAGAGLGSIGLVVGATIDRHAVGLDDALLTRAPILAPGFGAQGAELADAPRLFGAVLGQVLPNVSRSVLSAGPDGVAAAVAAAAQEVASWPR
ncbi:orotidine-5'-phosphate decarboxylase [Protaetiibacter sp. SSC-01]|uniref:orotidine-5'-phosphate decarboxylase n=1 Tax=Protaetiibacter sp. SSC-01 TaxID=2759943 RepID=UPI001656D580|nr:orotidine-5'-phosphate decarboxylase [Protaetiibacter sp. SSC-01]QNO36379.1 orotidine-5'-phosphate decarboxylase [Protaetiibacter sp. SSC-01]